MVSADELIVQNFDVVYTRALGVEFFEFRKAWAIRARCSPGTGRHAFRGARRERDLDHLANHRLALCRISHANWAIRTWPPNSLPENSSLQRLHAASTSSDMFPAALRTHHHIKMKMHHVQLARSDARENSAEKSRRPVMCSRWRCATRVSLRRALPTLPMCACVAISTAKSSSDTLRAGVTGGPGLRQIRSGVLTAGAARGAVPVTASGSGAPRSTTPEGRQKCLP